MTSHGVAHRIQQLDRRGKLVDRLARFNSTRVKMRSRTAIPDVSSCSVLGVAAGSAVLAGVRAVALALLSSAKDRFARFCRPDAPGVEYGDGRLSRRHCRWRATAASTHLCPSTPWTVTGGTPSSWATYSAIPRTPSLRHSASMRPSCLRPG